MIILTVGCDSTSSDGGNGGGDGGSEMGGDNGDMSGGDDGSGGSIVEAGGTLSENPETFAYIDGGTARQMLDFYRIEGLQSQTVSERELIISTERPVLVWFHGGGWVSGSKDNIEGIAFEIAELAGFHLVSVGYRLAGQEADPWPGIIVEVKSAVRWLKLNAGMLGIDPEQIIVTGESAGVVNEVSITQGGEHDVETLNVTAEQIVMFLNENVGK